MKPAEFLKHHPKTSYLDASFVDICGNLRGKRLPIEEFLKPWKSGVYLPLSVHLLSATGETLDSGGIGFSDGDPDGIGSPIPESLVPVTWTPKPGAQVLMTLDRLDGEPCNFDPRRVLQRTIDRLSIFGVRAVVAFELEFYLFDAERDAHGAPLLAPNLYQSTEKHRVDVYAFEPLDVHFDFFDTINRCAKEQRIDSSVATSEYAAGQFEINLNHGSDLMRLADQCVMFRRLVKGVALKHGMFASFMSKPLVASSGSGLHIHVSLMDESGQNVFASEEDPTRNKHLRQAVAGTLDTMADAMAIFAPNINSFRRFAPDSYAPVVANWGFNTRAVACRIPAGDASARRLEHRVAGADANPHLVLAAVLAGIEHGLKNELNPPDPVVGVNEAPDSAQLPKSWDEALTTLGTSGVLAESLGDEYIALYAEAKRLERSAFMSVPTAREFDWYL